MNKQAKVLRSAHSRAAALFFWAVAVISAIPAAILWLTMSRHSDKTPAWTFSVITMVTFLIGCQFFLEQFDEKNKR